MNKERNCAIDGHKWAIGVWWRRDIACLVRSKICRFCDTPNPIAIQEFVTRDQLRAEAELQRKADAEWIAERRESEARALQLLRGKE